MKTYVKVIILLSVVAVCVIGTYLVWKQPDPKDRAQNQTTAQDVKILELDKDKIDQVTVKNKEGDFVFEKKGADWVLVSPKDITFNKNSIISFIGQFSLLQAQKVVEDNAKDLAQYGLDKGVEVTIKMKDGTSKTLIVGSNNPTSDLTYVKLKDSNKVYGVSTDTGKNLIASKDTLIDKTLFPYQSSAITGITFERDGKEIFEAAKAGDAWKMFAPIKIDARTENMKPILDSLNFLSAESIEEENATDLSKYGLDKPSYAFTLVTATNKCKVLMGIEKEKGSSIYAKLADSNRVVTLGLSSFNYLDKPFKELIEPFVFIPNIDTVSRVVVTLNGTTVTSDIQTDKNDKKNDSFVVNGKDLKKADPDNGDSNFREYFQALIGIIADSIEPDAKPSGSPSVTLDYTLKVPGSSKIEFIKKDDRNYYAMKDGKYTGIVVDGKQFDQITETYKKIDEAINKK